MTQRIPLTSEGHARLLTALQRERQRLDEARLVVREQLEANEAESLGLVEAQQQLISIEARIEELEETLERAVIVQHQGNDQVCAIGATVTLHDQHSGRELRVRLVSPAEANVTERGVMVITSDSPVGTRLIGCRAGETFTVRIGSREVTYSVRNVQFE